MAKTKKHIISKNIDTTKLSPYASLRNMNSWRLTPVSDTFLDKFCEDLMSWSFQEDAFCLTQFLRYYGIHEQVFYDWVKKYEQVKYAHWVAMSNLGDKREIGALTKKYDSGTVEKVMAVYSSVWAAAEVRRSKLRREEQGDSFEDLTNCVRELVEQKWGDKKEK
jgi:hypothetical protein